MHTVAIVLGSLRAGSINRRLAGALEGLGADLFHFDYAEVDLPLYNEDLWPEPPESVGRSKAVIDAADAVLFVSPEYNRGVSPVLKNAFDWASRPAGKSSWGGKPVAIVGASPGPIGTAVAQSQLRAIVASQGAALMGAPGVALHVTPDVFDAEGGFAVERTRVFMRGFLEAFSDWTGRFSRG